MENFKVGYSALGNAFAATASIKEQLSGFDAGLVLYFVSSNYSGAETAQSIASAFDGARTVGCTTAGEMISGWMGQNSIVAMAWSKASLKDLRIEVLENVKNNENAAVSKAFKSFGLPMQDLDPEYVGMLLIDGLTGCEEKLNDCIGNLSNVPFVGGSAGDDFKFKQTWLFVDGKQYSNAAVLLLMRPTNGYAILKTQSLTITDKKLTPTAVNEATRTIIEFNGKPATEAIAEVLGITVDEFARTLGEHPVGLVYDENNFFVRSPMRIDGTAIAHYCSVKKGMDLTLLHSGDIIASTANDLKNIIKDGGGTAQAVIDFNCCLRATELNRKNLQTKYAEIFKEIPTIGFATYGESYIGHMNQTSAMLILK